MDEYPCKSKSPAYSGSDDNRDSANPVYSDPIDIRDFCDMNRFEKMMKDWATGTGLATVAVGKDGKYISGSYNFTEFCRDLTRKSPEGLRRCIECDRKGAGIYLCHAGLVETEPLAVAEPNRKRLQLPELKTLPETRREKG